MLDEIRGTYEVEFTVDDRQSVVDMWRENGLTCLQVEAWEENEVKSTRLRKPTLTLMVGPSGAGKSTWIEENTTANDTVFSSDRLRGILLGDSSRQDKNDQIFKILHTLVKTHLESGLDVIVDATNIRNKDRKSLTTLVDDVNVTYVVIDRPLVS